MILRELGTDLEAGLSDAEAARPSRAATMQVLRAGLIYFGLVFGAGFVLGTVRVLWIVPIFGARAAELIEIPIMLVVVAAGANWIVRGQGVPLTLSRRLGVGLVALALLVVAEFALVLWLRGLTIREYLANRDPVAGTAYLFSLVVFTIMPTLLARK